MEAASARVRVEPGGVEIDVNRDETLFAAAHRVGLLWPTTCFGQAQCTQCHVRLVSGHEHQAVIGADEAPVVARLERFTGAARGTLRLACRLRLTGDMVVEHRGVDAGGADGRVSSPSDGCDRASG